MKHNGINIPDEAILKYIERSAAFRKKVFQMFGGSGGKKAAANMTPEARKERAAKGAAAREKKRQDREKEI